MQKKLYYTQRLFNNKIKNRNLFILPEYINQIFYIYNGKSYIKLKIINEMIGYQFKNFIITKKKSIFKKKIINMGQKILPISLRLYKNKNWNSKWIVNEKIYSKFLYLDLEIKNYIFYFFKKNKTIKILKTDLKIFSKNIYVYIYIQQLPISFYNLKILKLVNYLFLFLNKNYKIKIFVIPVKGNSYFNFLVRKSYKILQKNNQYINYKLKQIFYTLLFFFITKNIQIISNFIFLSLHKKKYQKKQFNFINRFFLIFFKLFKNFKGYRIQLKGRINNKKRSQKLKYQKGKIPLNTLKYTIYYDCIPIITSSGLCNFKIWIFLTENQIKKTIFLKKLNQQKNVQRFLKNNIKKKIQK